MGLDQYAKKVKREYNHETLTETIVKTEIGYWRKHNALEGYMADLYRTKTGDQGEFNCKTLTLDSNDLDNLEKSLDNEALPETVGFFFGADADDHYAEADREFIVQARAAIKQGYKVIYSSWW